MVIIPFLLVCISHAQDVKRITVSKEQKLMGAPFEIMVVVQNEEIGYIHIDQALAEIARIEKMVSSMDSGSETNLINKNAGIKPVKVSAELFGLIQRAVQVSEITDGALDITYAPLDRIWRFDGTMERMPIAEDIDHSLAYVGYGKIILNAKERTVFLKEKGMKISLAALGKGYAIDRAKQLLVSKGVVAGMINASGDLTTWGSKASGKKWMLAIANPLNNNEIYTWLPIIESSVATSESYRKFVKVDGQKYSHIMDPRTGYPVRGLKKVLVFHKNAELSDALATAIMVMGKDAGISLIDQLGGAEVVIVDSNNRLYTSKGIILDNQ